MGVEVAIWTFAKAKRPVDVKGQWVHGPNIGQSAQSAQYEICPMPGYPVSAWQH
jgi:hypothetical protein